MIDRIIVVDNNTTRTTNFQKEIKEISLSESITVTLNGGHALLYLDHINHKIKDTKTLILLNIHTPIANGFEFLEGYKEAKLKKENIQIAVMEDNLKVEEIEKLKKFGVTNFFSIKTLFSNLSSVFSEYYHGSEVKKIQSSEVQTSPQIKKPRKKRIKTNDGNILLT